MAKRNGTGAMRERLVFQLQGETDSSLPDYGSPQAGPWLDQFQTAAEITPLKGGESVIASRLSGVQPYIIRIHGCSDARRVTVGWRVVDARNPSRVFNITSVANLDKKNAYLDIMAVAGVAT